MISPGQSITSTARLESLPRIVRFGIVGGIGAIVNLVTLLVLHGGLSLPLLIAVPVAVETSVLNNFIWNSQWTFAERPATRYGFLKFNLSCLVGLLICSLTVHLLVSSAGIHYLIADIAGIGLAAGSNFFFSNTWAWKREPAT